MKKKYILISWLQEFQGHNGYYKKHGLKTCILEITAYLSFLLIARHWIFAEGKLLFRAQIKIS
jgi:hypothetical protein